MGTSLGDLLHRRFVIPSASHIRRQHLQQQTAWDNSSTALQASLEAQRQGENNLDARCAAEENGDSGRPLQRRECCENKSHSPQKHKLFA